MFIIDAHEDIALNALYATGKDIGKRYRLHQGKSRVGLCVNNNVDIPRLQEGGAKFVFATIFSLDAATVAELIANPPAHYNFAKLKKLKTDLPGAVEQLAFYSDAFYRLKDRIEQVRTAKDYIRIKADKTKIGFITHSEGIDYIKSPGDLELFFQFGLRSLALTWRNKNLSGGGNNAKGGITALGRAIVARAQERGIIIDVAHANPATFAGVAQCMKKPFLVSHTNCYGLYANSRNVTDEQMKLVAAGDGVIGIAAITEHMGGATLARYVEHIQYAMRVVGSRHVGFGTDFDGMVDPEDKFMKGFEDASKFGNVLTALRRAGVKEREIEMMAYRNMERVILANLPATS